MSATPDIPTWAAVTVAILVLVGSIFTLIGALGLVRLPTFYDRAHAPTMGSSGAIACITIAAIICFSTLEARGVLGAGLIFVFVTLTMPVTLMLLARAALFRDRAEGNPDVPPPVGLMNLDDTEGGGSRSF